MASSKKQELWREWQESDRKDQRRVCSERWKCEEDEGEMSERSREGKG